MIFVTVGTHNQRFDRLLDALHPLSELDTLIVQHGPGAAPASADLAVAYMAASEIERHMRDARVVVCHAGVGSFLMARRAGHAPVMVPRLRRYGEHVDDHQLELARALEREGKAIAVWAMDHLVEAVRLAPPRTSRELELPGALHAALRHAMDGEPLAGEPTGFRARGQRMVRMRRT